MRKTATGRDIEVLMAIKTYMKEHGYAPTVREVGQMVGLNSPSSVKYYFDNLYAQGYIETDLDMSSPRAFRLTKKGEKYGK